MRHKHPFRVLFPLLMLLFVLTTSCGMVSAVREARDVLRENKAEIAASIGSAKEVIGFVREMVDKVKPMIEKADFGGIGQMASQLMSMKDELKSSMAELKAANSAAFEKADKNKDGQLSGIGEWLAYLLAGGAGAAEIVRRLLKRVRDQALSATAESQQAVMAAVQGHVERLDGRIDHERAKRKEAEAEAEGGEDDSGKVGFDPKK